MSFFLEYTGCEDIFSLKKPLGVVHWCFLQVFFLFCLMWPLKWFLFYCIKLNYISIITHSADQSDMSEWLMGFRDGHDTACTASLYPIHVQSGALQDHNKYKYGVSNLVYLAIITWFYHNIQSNVSMLHSLSWHRSNVWFLLILFFKIYNFRVIAYRIMIRPS